MNMKLAFPTLLSVLACATQAAESPAVPGVQKSLVVEMVISYVVEKIDVPVRTASPAAFQTPEQAVEAHFSAMWAGDWNAFLLTWDSAARAVFTEDVNAKRRDVPAVQEQWRRSLGGAQVRLINRIKFNDFVLLEYRLERPGLATPLTDTVALKKTGDGWKLTQDLAAHPILASWNAPSSRVRLSPTYDTMRCFKY
jgi:hypothetical protein